MTTLPDETLIALYLEDRQGHYFGQLYTRYYAQVYHKCLQFTKDQAEAEDAAHDIFAKVIDRLDSFKGNARFSTWLYAVTRNFCADRLQLRRTALTVRADADTLLNYADESDDGPDEAFLQQLQQCIDGLTATEQRLLVSRYWGGASIEELAVHNNLTMSAVKMRLHRARHQIRVSLTPYLSE
jgi:RNA polymerase sigma factor (sigma-70 family)